MRTMAVARALLLTFAIGSCADPPSPPPSTPPRRAPRAVPSAPRTHASGDADPAPEAQPAPPPRESRLDLDELRRLGRTAVGDDGAADDVARAVWRQRDTVVPLLVEALRAGDGAAARGARLAFAIVPREGIPALISLAGDPDDRVRAAAVSCLSRLTDWWVVDPCRDAVVAAVADGIALGDERERRDRIRILRISGARDARVVGAARARLATATGDELHELGFWIAELGPEARDLAPDLLARMDGLPSVRTDAARRAVQHALAAVGPPDPSFVRVFADRLSAPRDVRATLGILAAWGDDAAPACDAIMRLLASDDDAVRNRAIETLVRVPGGAEAAVRAAVADFAARAVPPDWNAPIRSLAHLGPRYAEALPWIEETLRAGSVEQRAAAARALGHLPDDAFGQIRPLLLEAFASDEPRVRECAAWSLFWPPSTRQTDDALYARALADSWGEVRRVALMASAWPYEGTRDADAARRVGAFLGDPDPAVRFWAGNLIERIGAPPSADAVAAIRTSLRSPDRLVRLGALRAAKELGPAAAPAIQELLEIVRTDEFSGWALDVIAATGRLDDALREEIRSAVAGDRWALTRALTAFGERGSFLEDLGREIALDGDSWNGLAALAGATADRHEFAKWLADHRQEVDERDFAMALRALGPEGLPALLAWTAEQRPSAVEGLREHVRALGPAAAAPLVTAVETAPPAEAALALRVLLDVLPQEAGAVAREGLTSRSPELRALALRAAGAVPQLGVGTAALAAAVRRGLQDDPMVRAAALDVIAVDPSVIPAPLATARESLEHDDPEVRVAAARAVFAITQDAAEVLPTLRAALAVPVPYWSWGMIGHAPARPVDEYGATERAWVAAAGALSSMGRAGAPAAEDLAWAALRHGDPGLQRRMISALEPMGPAASDAARLVRQLRASSGMSLDARFGDDPDRLEKTVARVLRAIEAH